jgi:three-Cys-motif partner protein
MTSGQQVVIASDNLPALKAGPWTNEKLFFLRRYAHIFNQGMKNLWQTRVYIDLFAGPGIDVVEGSEVEGSPLVALRCKVPFTHYFLNDSNGDFVGALETRVTNRGLGATAAVEYSALDCNDAARQIGDRVPRGALIIVFVDPWNWEIHFDSIRELVADRHADLLVTFHTGSIKRNAHNVLQSLDQFLGDTVWRERFQAAREGERTRAVLDAFQEKLQPLGYPRDNIDDRVLMRNSQNTPLYHVVYASKAARGKDFWEKISSIQPSGQRRMF